MFAWLYNLFFKSKLPVLTNEVSLIDEESLTEDTEKEFVSKDTFIYDKVEAFRKLGILYRGNESMFDKKFNTTSDIYLNINKKIDLDNNVTLYFNMEFSSYFPKLSVMLRTRSSNNRIYFLELWYNSGSFSLNKEEENKEFYSEGVDSLVLDFINEWIVTFDNFLNGEKALITNALQKINVKQKKEVEKSPLVRRIEEKILPALSESFSQLPEEEQLKRVDAFEQTLMSLKEKVAVVQKENDSSEKILSYERQLAVAVGFAKGDL